MSQMENLTGLGMAGQLAREVIGSPAAVTCAGTSTGNATQISVSFNVLTAAASQTGAKLPSGTLGSAIGDEIICYTTSSTSAIVYPAAGETCNNASSVTVAQYKMLTLRRVSATLWGYVITP